MGYKVLGYMVWQGTKWYVRRRAPGAPPKAALVVGFAGVAGAALPVARSSRSAGPPSLSLTGAPA